MNMSEIEKEYKAAFLAFENFAIRNLPEDPVERAMSALAYERARARFHAAREALQAMLRKEEQP